MKKFILFLLLVVPLFVFGQQEEKTYTKKVIITSRTLTSGGVYTMIPSVQGRAIALSLVRVTYDFKSTPYTMVGVDTLNIKTDVGLADNQTIASFSSNSFTATRDYVIFARDINSTATFNNKIDLSIPTGLFTLGDADLIFTFEYQLFKP